MDPLGRGSSSGYATRDNRTFDQSSFFLFMASNFWANSFSIFSITFSEGASFFSKIEQFFYKDFTFIS